MNVPNTNDEFAVTDSRSEPRHADQHLCAEPARTRSTCSAPTTTPAVTGRCTSSPNLDAPSSRPGYCYQSRDFDLDGADAAYADFQDLLAEQDRIIVESQLPLELPLDLGDELQLPFDRVAIAYRRALKRISEPA